MHILISPIHYIRRQRARRKQLQMALHMLSVSGVIRAGHIEPRYFEPCSHVDALYRRSSNRSTVSAARAAATSANDKSTAVDWTKLRHVVVPSNRLLFR